MKETHPRSLIKTITFRALASITTLLIVYVFTGRILLSIGIAIVETIVKMFIYYLHERVWGVVRWGKLQHPLSQLPAKKDLTPEQLKVITDRLKDLGYLE